jgi:hypothetical protein
MGYGQLTAEDKEKVAAALCADVLPRHLGFFEHMLQSSPTPWLAGTAQPSIADLSLAPRFKAIAENTVPGCSLPS